MLEDIHDGMEGVREWYDVAAEVSEEAMEPRVGAANEGGCVVVDAIGGGGRLEATAGLGHTWTTSLSESESSNGS